jgi:hypothetical protein
VIADVADQVLSRDQIADGPHPCRVSLTDGVVT